MDDSTTRTDGKEGDNGVLPSACPLNASANGASDTDCAFTASAEASVSQQEEQSKKRARTSAAPVSKDKESRDHRWNDMEGEKLTENEIVDFLHGEADHRTASTTIRVAEKKTQRMTTSQSSGEEPAPFNPLLEILPMPSLSHGSNAVARRHGDAHGPGAFALDGPGHFDSPRPPTEVTASPGSTSRDEEEGTGASTGLFGYSAELVLPHQDTPVDVCTEEEEEVFEGTVIQTRPKNPTKSRHISMFLGCCLVGLIILVPLMFSLQGRSSEDTDDPVSLSPNPSASAAPVDYYPFSDDLPVSVLQEIKKNSDSPFDKANRWVLEDPNLDHYSLERLMQRFFSTNGEGWIQKTDWLSYNVSECAWFSSSSLPKGSPYFQPNICDANGTVVNLSLAKNNLTGSLPIWCTPFLPILQVLDVANNNIGAHIPTATTTPYLEVLILSHNAFVGSPTFNAGPYFPNLKVFKADGLMIEDDEKGAFLRIVPNMEVYNITGLHRPTGNFHTNIGLLPHLKYYGGGHTTMSSTIPSEIGLCTNLETLDVSSLPNVFGTIPSQLGQLTQLTLFDLEDSPQITGNFPPGLCDRVHNGLLSIQANCSILECC